MEDGTEFEDTRDKDPLEFLVGSGRVVGGIEAAVQGMVLGERRDVTVPCQDAFGYGLKNRIVNISIFEFAEEINVGDRLGIKGLFAVIKRISDDGWVEVDANHPLAGEDLYLDLKVVELVKARALEVATFSGGSFWELEITFQRVDGVGARATSCAPPLPPSPPSASPLPLTSLFPSPLPLPPPSASFPSQRRPRPTSHTVLTRSLYTLTPKP